MRARRRPLVVLSIAGVRLLLGLALALPLASLVAESGVGQSPRGDRVLFEAGGYMLLEVLRLQGPNLAAAARGVLPLLLVGFMLTAACNAALLVALNLRGRLRWGPWLSRAFSYVPAQVVLGVGTGLAQLVVLLAGLLLTDAVPTSLERPVAVSAMELSIWLLAALVTGGLGSVSDVAKAALVRDDAGLTAAVQRAFACARRAPVTAILGFLPYGLLLIAAVWGAAHLTSLLDVSRGGAWRVACVLVLHQAVSLASVALRAAWYARALRLAASS
jgi:hypothetical protein